MWFAWLGWDHSYYYAHGVRQGPYGAWQVVGCALSITAMAVVGYLRTEALAPVTVLSAAGPVGFAIPWAVAASVDESGLWVVGLTFILIGGFIGLVVVLAFVESVATPKRSPDRALLLCGVVAASALMFYPLAAIPPFIAGVWVFFRRWLPNRGHGVGTA